MYILSYPYRMYLSLLTSRPYTHQNIIISLLPPVGVTPSMNGIFSLTLHQRPDVLRGPETDVFNAVGQRTQLFAYYFTPLTISRADGSLSFGMW